MIDRTHHLRTSRGSLAGTLAVFLIGAGCSGSGGGGQNPSPSGPDAAIDPTYGDVIGIDWGPVTVQPGEENTQCVVVELPNDQPVHIGKIHNQLGATSHHMILYKVSSGTPNSTPTDCQPFEDALDPSKGAPIAITQRDDEVITLPPGVGLTLEAHQLIRIELHYINVGDTVQTDSEHTDFYEIPDADFRDEADFLFIGNPDVDIQAHSKATLGPSYLPLPAELDGIHVFAITGHEHQWGTGVTVQLARGADDPGTDVYAPDNFVWSEPPTVYMKPPVEIPTGSGFRFTCTWNNESGQEVKFGESFNDEMCFFWAYYYPSQGSRVCVHSDDYGVDACCPGNPLCSLIGQ